MVVMRGLYGGMADDVLVGASPGNRGGMIQ